MTDNPAAWQPEVELVELPQVSCEVASETDEAGEAGAALRMPSPSSSEGSSTELGSLPSREVSPESSELQAYLVYRQAAVERGGGSVRPDNESAAVDGDGRTQAAQAHEEEEEEEENEEQEEQGPADGSPMSAQLCIHVVRDPDSGAAGYTVHRSSLVISATNEESVAYANGMREGYRITHVDGRQIQVRPLPPHLVHGRHMSSVPLLDCKW